MGSQCCTILLVEDEPVIALAQAQELEREGYDVMCAARGEEAIELVRDNPGRIDLILMDIDLGKGLDGTQVARAILKDHDIPVVFLSSHTEKEIVEKTEQITSYGYVVKKSGITVLLASLRMAFKLHEAYLGIQARNLELEAANRNLLGSQEELSAREDALRESEERYRCLFEQGSDALFVADPQSRRLVDCNSKAEELTGFSREALLSMNADQLHPDDVRPVTMDYFREFVKGNRADAVETVVLTMNGSRVPVSINAGIVKVGGSTLLIGIFRDISDKKCAEEAQREHARKIDTIINNLNGVLYRCLNDRDWTMEYLSEGILELSGYPSADFLGNGVRSYNSIIAPEDRDRIWDEIQEALGSGRSYTLEYCIVTAAGERRWVWERGRGVPGESGTVTLEGFITDVSARRTAEAHREAALAALGESERRMNDILDHVGAFIFIKDTAYRYTYANKKVRELFGRDEQAIIGRSDEDFFSAGSIGEIRTSDRRVIEEGETVTREETDLVSSDGHPRTYWTVKIPLTDASGAVNGLCGISTDITDWKRTQSQARAYARFLEKLEKIDNVIMHADNLNEMLKNLLDSVLGIFKCDRAWLLFPCDPSAPSFRVIMQRTRKEYPADLAENTDLPVLPDVAAVFREILETAGPVTFDPASGREIPYGKEFSTQSQIVVGIRPRTGLPWVFGLHQCSHARIWSIEEQRLFREIGRRVTDGLSSMLFLGTLRESEEKFRALVENLNVGIFSSTPDGAFLHANRSMAALAGYASVEELLRVPVSGLYADPRDGERLNLRIGEHGHVSNMEILARRKNGSIFWLSMSAVLLRENGAHGESILGMATDITERKRIEEALDRRIVALTRPLGENDVVTFEELFSLDDIQVIQDLFAKATGVASIITQVDGTPITRPSGFCRLCSDIIRRTEKGLSNCYHSDAVLGRYHPDGPVIQPCLSGGLWDAGASITVGGRHVANWLIGQVRDETQSENRMRAYAHDVGADEEEFIAAFHEVPTMPRERFEDVARALFVFANQLSLMAHQNIQQARIIVERKEAVDALTRSVAEKEMLFKELQHRVKNSLNIASNLISLKMGDLPDEHTRGVFADVIARIGSIAAVYEQLQTENDLDRIDLGRYVGRLVSLLRQSYAPAGGRVLIADTLEAIQCEQRCAVPVGLILNELVTNALKYAYPPGAAGEIRVDLRNRGGKAELLVSDDGPGIDEKFRHAHKGGMGLRLVDMLCRQIGGVHAIEEGPGARIRVTFPV
ncbi:MAG: PAS domain S-box protein [Spirochaetes bacterium]|nr:MAG: PAS domain S-box protein [Spirochaetota bacterium]